MSEEESGGVYQQSGSHTKQQHKIKEKNNYNVEEEGMLSNAFFLTAWVWGSRTPNVGTCVRSAACCSTTTLLTLLGPVDFHERFCRRSLPNRLFAEIFLRLARE